MRRKHRTERVTGALIGENKASATLFTQPRAGDQIGGQAGANHGLVLTLSLPFNTALAKPVTPWDSLSPIALCRAPVCAAARPVVEAGTQKRESVTCLIP
jgi:hypothetical protein